MSMCAVFDCGRPPAKRGLCVQHYKRFRRYGDATVGGPIKRYAKGSPHDRLMRYVDRADHPDTCWEWVGGVSTQGYGRLGDGYAHRISYEVMVGPIPDGLELDHLCRNRRCINPNHLEVVTAAENTRRGMSPSMVVRRNRTCSHGHTLSGGNLYIRKSGGWQCRTCKRLRMRTYSRQKRAA